MKRLLFILPLILVLACGGKKATEPVSNTTPPPPPPPVVINPMHGTWRGRMVTSFGRDSMILLISKDSTILTTWGTKYTDRQKAANVAINDPVITFTVKELTLTGYPDTSFTLTHLNVFNLSGARIANGIDGNILDFRFNQAGTWIAKKQ